MSPDYRDAAERHWEDATYLLADNRPANADHLFGLSAECALKAVMVGLGMALDSSGAPQDRKHRVHIDDLWDEFISFASGRGYARYANILSGTSPFVGWSVADRYAHRSYISQAVAEQHRGGCVLSRQVLNDALLDGVVL